MHVDTTFRGNFESYTTLVLHAAPGVSPLDPASLKDSLESIWWRPAGAGTQAWLALQDAEIIDDAATVQLLIRYDGTSPNNPTMVPQLVDRLNALAATTANLSDA